MPKIVDRDEYSQELLRKSFDLFARYGYSSITMRQIASELNVSTGTLYHYFPSKESLFEQLVDYLSRQDTSPEEIAKLGNPQTLAERIDGMMNFVAKNEEYLLKKILIMIDFSQHKEPDVNNEALQRAENLYEEALCQYLGISNRVFANFIVNQIEGFLLRRFYLGERFAFAEETNLLREILITYLEQK